MISRGEEDSAFRRGYDGGFTAGLHSRDELLREASAIVMELLTDYCEGGYDEKIIVDTEKYIDKLQSALKEE